MRIKKWKTVVATMTAAFAFATVGALVSSPVDADAAVSVEYESVMVNGETVKAQTLGEQTVRLAMDKGASVRVSKDGETTGLRFSSFVYTADYDAIIAAGGSFGVLIRPTDSFEGEFTHATGTVNVDYLDIAATNTYSDANTGLTQFNGVITKIHEDNYAREFSARGYAELNGEYVYTDYDAQEHSRSAKNVAMDAVANGLATEKNTAQLEAYIGASVNDVQVVDLDNGKKFGYLVSEGRTHLPVSYKEYNVFDGWLESGNPIENIAAGTTVDSLTASYKSVMGDGVLDNFDDKVSSLKRYTVGVHTDTGDTLVAPSLADQITWLPSHTIGEDTRNGVLKVSLGYNQFLSANFTRTAEELEALGVESIIFDMSWVSTTENNNLYFHGTGETAKHASWSTTNPEKWTTVVLDISTLNSYARTNGNWCESFGLSETINCWLMRATLYNESIEVYIDEIRYAANRTVEDGVLENFSTADSRARVSLGSATTGNHQLMAQNVQWLESYTVGEETKYGVMKLEMNGEQYFWMDFSRTAQELEDLNISAISFTLYGMKPLNTSDYWQSIVLSSSSDTTTVNLSANYYGWMTKTITVEQLKSLARFQNADGEMDWSKLGSDNATGVGSFIFHTTATQTIYIDEITYVAAEKPMPEGVFENFSHINSASRFVIKNTSGAATATQPVWLESHADENGDVKEGVLEVALSANTFLYANFTRTEAELDALIASGITKMTFVLALTPTGASDTGLRWSASSGDTYKMFGSASYSNVWYEWTIDLTQVKYHTRFSSDGTQTGSLDIGSLGSDAAGNFLIRAPYAVTVYIAEISYS